MRFALRYANVGIWDTDYTTGKLRWTELEAQYGFSPGAFDGTLEGFVERFIPTIASVSRRSRRRWRRRRFHDDAGSVGPTASCAG
jgi:hypothetical protein